MYALCWVKSTVEIYPSRNKSAEYGTEKAAYKVHVLSKKNLPYTRVIRKYVWLTQIGTSLKLTLCAKRPYNHGPYKLAQVYSRLNI